MRHLRDVEFIDFMDGRLSPERRAHVESCEHCRAEVGRLHEAAAGVSDDPAPAPSPLFWDHFTARVSEAIRQEPDVPVREPMWVEWLRHPVSIWAGGAVVAILMIATVAWRATLHAPADSSRQPVTTTAAVEGLDETPIAEADDPGGPDGDDAAWSLVQSAADGLEWEEANAAGISVRPGAIERAALELTPDERAELVRLLESEIKADELRRSGA